jgi:hypothetical protein
MDGDIAETIGGGGRADGDLNRTPILADVDGIAVEGVGDGTDGEAEVVGHRVDVATRDIGDAEAGTAGDQPAIVGCEAGDGVDAGGIAPTDDGVAVAVAALLEDDDGTRTQAVSAADEVGDGTGRTVGLGDGIGGGAAPEA